MDDDGSIWCFCLLLAKGDEECHCQDWGLPHYNSAEPCSECLGNRTDKPFTDLRATAAWRGTCPLPAEAYFARVRAPRHPLLASPMATRMMCYLDLMHMVDCKGVASWVFGGVLHHLLREPALGPNKKARLERVNADRTEWYGRHPTLLKLPRILLASCTKDDWAELCGPAFKAANTRQAAKFFEHMAHKYCVGDSPVCRHIRLLTSSLVGFYNCLYSAGMFLTPEEQATLRGHCQDFGSSYQRLRNLAQTQHQLVWPVKPKVHKMMHVPELAAHLNPVHAQCYGEESFMGTTSKVWRKSMSGRYQHGVQTVVLVKRLTGLLLRLDGAAN